MAVEDIVLWVVGVLVAVAVLGCAAGIYYLITVLGPQEAAWRAACEAQGGIPVPTRVSHGKYGTRYGYYVCARLEIIGGANGK